MKRWLIALLVVAVAISGLTLVAYAQQGKSKMIIVGAAGASPKTATIAKGTTVVWLNSSNDNVSIYFSKGKEVEAVCAAPSRFAIDSEGKYNSGPLPQGGTASICFLEAGKYQYDVVGQKIGGLKSAGTVVVK
jgi:plastocyanin